MLVWIVVVNTRGSSGSTHKHLAQYLIVVPRPMPAAPRRYLIMVARRLNAAVVCHIYLIVVPGRCPRRRSLCVART